MKKLMTKKLHILEDVNKLLDSVRIEKPIPVLFNADEESIRFCLDKDEEE